MVKRAGFLMERIADKDNLREAFLRAARGKSMKKSVVEFRKNLTANIDEMSRMLLNGTWRFGNYHFFKIYDPKPRMICAASFPERVVFHAIMRICHPVFDDYQIFDSYASRKEKGQYEALFRARKFCRRYEWFAKTDVCKYFDSVDHEIMYGQLCRLFKDRQLLGYFHELLDSYDTGGGRGLPIGNLTSQYFANHYLSVADHYAKETLKVPAMVRYMDDVVFFDDDRRRLHESIDRYRLFLLDTLRLQCHDTIINRTEYGIPYLGYVVRGRCLRLNLRSKRRYKKKMIQLKNKFMNNEIDDSEYACRATCMLAFVNKASASGFLHSVSKELYP